MRGTTKIRDMNATRGTTVARQRRASKPKVKTGCNNCKKRKVKCDETRPQCVRCVKKNWVCDGYPAIKRRVETLPQIAPRPLIDSPVSSSTSPTTATSSVSPTAIQAVVPTSRTSQLIRRAPSYTPPRREILSPTTYSPGTSFGTQEGQYFQVFRTHTAVELSGFFNSEFWSRSVLQESESEAAIRHAVVALGALYKTMEKFSESPPSSPSSQTPRDAAGIHYEFAFEQYGLALARLREALSNRQNSSQRSLLVFNVLSTCFLSFIGDHKAAINQIQSGLGILESRRQESRQPLITRSQDFIEDELVQIFTRLAIQAKSYDMAFHLPDVIIQLSPKNPEQTSPQSPGSPSDAASTASIDSLIPGHFSSAQEARAALDSLTERIMRLNEILSNINPGPNNILPRSVAHQSAGFMTALRQWGTAFEQLLQNRRTPGVGNTERACILVLKMMHTMTTILFYTGYSTSEMDFDKYIPMFKEIVEFAREIVVDEELSLRQKRCGPDPDCRHQINAMNQTMIGQAYKGQDSYLHIRPSFALDLGIIPSLFVVATKCRQRVTRRMAIHLLLQSPRREGMWDSIMSGLVAGWIMHIEEDGMSPYDQLGPSANELVPDEKRVMVKEIDPNIRRRWAKVRCGTRGKREGEADPRARSTEFWW